MRGAGTKSESEKCDSAHLWCIVITSYMSVAVSGFGAELLLGGNVLCNILMACYRCFCRIIHGTYLSVPSHSNSCLSHPTGFPL